MGRRNRNFIASHNRVGDSCIERRCCKCEKWMGLERFKLTHDIPGYICLDCEAVRQRGRYAKYGKPGRTPPPGTKKPIEHHPRIQQFDDARVDVFGLMCFATMPTPQQLIERKAA